MRNPLLLLLFYFEEFSIRWILPLRDVEHIPIDNNNKRKVKNNKQHQQEEKCFCEHAMQRNDAASFVSLSRRAWIMIIRLSIRIIQQTQPNKQNLSFAPRWSWINETMSRKLAWNSFRHAFVFMRNYYYYLLKKKHSKTTYLIASNDNQILEIKLLFDTILT